MNELRGGLMYGRHHPSTRNLLLGKLGAKKCVPNHIPYIILASMYLLLGGPWNQGKMIIAFANFLHSWLQCEPKEDGNPLTMLTNLME